MCEKCDEMADLVDLEDDGIFDREVRLTLTVGEMVSLMTASEIIVATGVIAPLVAARAKLQAALIADRDAFQEGEWPEEVTEVEQ